MKHGAKKGQAPKKPIKQIPSKKTLGGLEIAAIGALAGLAGSALMGGGKGGSTNLPINPAATIAPLSTFVGKKEEEEKPGMKEGGVAKMKESALPVSTVKLADPLSTPSEAKMFNKILSQMPLSKKKQGMKKGGLSGGEKDGAPPMKGPMSEGMMGGGMMYNDAMGMKDGGMTLNDKMGMEGGVTRGQKDIQVKKKVFKGIF